MRIKDKEIIALVLLLIFAFYINHYPHQGYNYPVHVDEWSSFTRAKAIYLAENYFTPDPYIAGKETKGGLEVGFYMWLAELKILTGLDWLLIFKYLPALIAVLLVLSTYIFARNYGYGLEAGLFVSVIPTTVRLLGPGFLVAISLGIVFIPLSLFLARKISGKNLLLILFIILSFLLIEHPPTALVVFVVLVLYSFLNFRRGGKFGPIILAIILSSMLSFHHFLDFITTKPAIGELIKFSAVIPIGTFPEFISHVTIVFFIVGVFLMAREKRYIMITSVIVFLVLLAVFRQLGYTFFIMPTRGYMYTMFLMSIIAGFALHKTIRFKPLYLFLVALVIVMGVQNIWEQPYYHIISEQEYNDFLWIKENTAEDSIVLLHPWKANALPSIAERNIYTRIPPRPSEFYTERNEKAFVFFAERCNDTEFLKENNISVVYSPVKCNNTDLSNPRDNIYFIH